MHEKARIQIHNAAKLILYIMHYSKLCQSRKMEGERCGRHTIREVWNRNKLFLLLNLVKIKVLSRNSKGVKMEKTEWWSIGSGLQ